MRSGAFVMSSGCVRHCPVTYGHLWTICGRVQGYIDALLGAVLLSCDALGVDPQQDGDAVPCPFGDLGGRHASVEPKGHARVPQVVGTASQR